MTNTYFYSSIIKKSFYENSLTHRTLNFLNRCEPNDDYILHSHPILYKQVDIEYPNSDMINSKFLHVEYIKLIKAELKVKYPKFQRERSEFEKTMLMNESKNTNSYLNKLPMDVVDYYICEFL